MGKAEAVLEKPRAQSGAPKAKRSKASRSQEPACERAQSSTRKERKKENPRQETTASTEAASSRDARHLDPKELGSLGELAAVRFLKRHGFDILEQNWKCLAGEADIIAREGDNLVFVEVKTRAGVDKGLPEEAVDKKKRQRYERIAALYLSNYEVADIQVRFDIISILVVAADRALLRHHRSAFSVST